jgi:hypothetical protein
MLVIDLGTLEYYDSEKSEFAYESGGKVRFEYSLKAVYEWEGRWKKPFLKGELTYFELIDFYKLMALDDFDIKFLNEEVIRSISEYIQNTNTATKFTDTNSSGAKVVSNKVHTSEEIYAMMFSAGIDLDFENRNLNRLLTILKIISVQNNPPKKMSKEEVLKQNRDYNRQRKEQMKSKG